MNKTAMQVMQDTHEAKIKQLEEKYAEEAAKILQEEIDQEILFDLLKQIGWIRVELSSKWLPVTGIELHEWREANLTGRWHAHNNVWMFENKNDAALFKLTWS